MSQPTPESAHDLELTDQTVPTRLATPAGRETPVPRRTKRRPLVYVVAAVAALAFGYVGVSAFGGSVVYYRTPSEVVSLPGQHLRLAGTVVPGTIKDLTAPMAGVLFSVTDGATTIRVSFQGAVPVSLRDSGEVVADGALDSAGVFQAQSLLTKCPSKFSEQTGKS